MDGWTKSSGSGRRGRLTGLVAGATLAIAIALTIIGTAAAAVPTNTAAPTISGTLQTGSTLTASAGSWNGTGTITYAYDWQRCDPHGNGCGDVKGATAATYQLGKADENHTLRVAVTASDTDGANTAVSALTATITAAPLTPPAPKPGAPANTGLPTIAGNVQEGATLTASTGTWAKSTIQTRYDARWNGATSSSATVGVQPLVTFHLITHKRFTTKVVAAKSFSGKVVQFQRRNGSKWVTMKRIRLGANSGAIFKVALPKGASTLRMAFSVNQAGAGYLGGTSRTIVYPLHLT